jgi:TolB-like protein
MADSRQIGLLLSAVSLSLLAGCTILPAVDSQPAAPDAAADRLVPANHQAVDKLLSSLQPGVDFPKNQPVIVATIVNVDDLTSSRLGRMLSEQIGTRLTQRGYPVIELKLRGNIFMKQSEGELLLSREVQDLTLRHKAQAVVVGTYAEARGYVYVTLKLIDATTNQSMAAYDYALPLDGTVYSLLRPNGR